jgi:hypothetical protein
VSIVAGRVDVPDFIVAGHGGLPQGSDLAQRQFGEGHCAFVFVEHGSRPKVATALSRPRQ